MTDDFRNTATRRGAPVSVPRVRTVADVELEDDDWISFQVDSWAPLPDEFYLRVLQHYDGDSDMQEIVDLIRTYGQLCLDDFVEWDGGSMGNWEQRSIALQDRMEYMQKRKEGFLAPETLLRRWEAAPHLDRLRFLRDGWIVASATGDLAEYAQLFEDIKHGQSIERTTRDWVDGLNKGLSAAHPRIEHPFAHEEGATLFGASCLQLYNHMMEGAQYKICANESCGQFFVRQQGRSASLQRKNEGIKYCSSKCARAQAQRELRRRRAPARPRTEAVATGAQATDEPSLGQTLRAARLKSSEMDDRTVRRKAGVVAPILVAVEADDFSRYPGQDVHMERWLSSLAKLYQLDPKEILARYRAAARG
ncbi:hypothetical protein [Streptomyces antimycoticus]|uniref:hypothetical protein n=1 Tax=Streptomyces antimycoticus TaxID=68175 RepID=UPI00386FD841|nr:hypothetical protein OG751_23020 [Streptomyces antimycoticus]